MSADLILLGTIGSPHGVNGAVRIRTYTAEPAAIADYGILYDAQGRTYEIVECRPDKTGIVARFSGVSNRDAAEALKGTDLFIDRTALPEPDDNEFYYSDLTGLAVEDCSGKAVGTVRAVFDHGAGEFLEIAVPDGRSLLVPFTNAAVPVIDIEAGRIVVDPPPETEARPDGPKDEEGKT